MFRGSIKTIVIAAGVGATSEQAADLRGKGYMASATTFRVASMTDMAAGEGSPSVT